MGKNINKLVAVQMRAACQVVNHHRQTTSVDDIQYIIHAATVAASEVTQSQTTSARLTTFRLLQFQTPSWWGGHQLQLPTCPPSPPPSQNMSESSKRRGWTLLKLMKAESNSNTCDLHSCSCA